MDSFSSCFEISPLNLFFNQVFYINLDRRKDRRQSIEKQLIEFNIQATRVSAVDGNNYACLEMPKTPRGSVISHRIIVEYAAHKKLESIFIFEDDAKLSPNFNSILSKELPLVPDDWDFLFLGSCHEGRLKHKISEHLFSVPQSALCIYSYGINNKAYDIFIDKVWGYRAADQIIKEFSKTNKLKTYIMFPSLVTQIPNKSDNWPTNGYNNLIE